MFENIHLNKHSIPETQIRDVPRQNLFYEPGYFLQAHREMRVKLRNHQNINATNPTRKETRFPFHYHVTFRVCPTAKSSHRAKIVSRGNLLIGMVHIPKAVRREKDPSKRTLDSRTLRAQCVHMSRLGTNTTQSD